MKQKNPKNTQNFITSKKHVKEILKYTNINKQDKIIGYNELLRLVHYNRQGEGYNETEKPEKYAKFHYI